MDSKTRLGLLLGLGCYLLWGGLVYFWYLLRQINSFEVFSYRIIFTVITLLIYFLLTGKRKKVTSELKELFQQKKSLSLAVLASICLGLNWLAFIYSVAIHQATQGSIANFIMPLVSILLSVIFLREQLEKYMWLAVGIAAIGVLWMILGAGKFPLLTVVMSVCFPAYGLLKKYYRLSSDVALFFESLVLLPFVLAYLGFFVTKHFWDYSAWNMFGLFVSGIVTAIPLLLFAEALKRAPLHLLCFIQYVNPSIALILSVTLLGEQLTGNNLVSLLFIWAGILVFISGEFLARSNSSS